MEDTAVWEALPADEKRSVWDETEIKFWNNFERDQQKDRAAAEKHFQDATLELKLDFTKLSGRRSQLSETRDRLAKELAKIEQDLALVGQQCEEKSMRLHAIESDYLKKKEESEEKREHVYFEMKRFFKEKRGEDTDGGRTSLPYLPPPPKRQPLPASKAPSWRDHILNHDDDTPMQDARRTNGDARATPSTAAPVPDGHESADVLVNVVDADDNIIGPVMRIDGWNQWVREIQEMKVKRPVKIRRGRRFGPDHLSTIYERSEGKGVKWLSCMIQATGDVAPRRCHSCDKNQGAFEECIVLGGSMFQKCGNCEWNRQGCHMPTANGSNIPGSPLIQESNIEAEDLEQEHAGSSWEARRAEVAREALAKASGLPVGGLRESLYVNHADKDGSHLSTHKSPVLSEPVQMPTPQEPKEHAFVNSTPVAGGAGFRPVNGFTAANGLTPGGSFTPANGFTPANTRNSRPSSRDILTPSALSVETSPQPTPPASEPLEEITRANLILENDGTVYTYPEIVQGVPLVKIDEDHPYWELGWKPLKPQIEAQLATWREKNAVALEAKNRGEGGSAKFQTGRQVNRGVKILEFLEQGEISPYQLISKKFIHTGKGAITSYDTLFRMCETLAELAKFKLDVTPIEWMRHRLHEIMMQRGPNFNVAKVIHDFYHDKKLTALRVKNGYKSIGRPSGYKPGQSKTPQGSAKKRKSMHSEAGTPRETPSRALTPLDVEEIVASPALTHATSVQTEAGSLDTLSRKRLKTLSPPTTLDVGEYSDTDSFSGAPLASHDWRLYQIKTRAFTSSIQVTQYWNWKEKERMFEHQLLKDTEPTTWGVHRDPIDFNVRLDDIVEVRWNIDVLQVHIVMSKWGTAIAKQDGQPRGDVMAAFKRERTIRRFLDFCRAKRLRTSEVPPYVFLLAKLTVHCPLLTQHSEDMEAEWGLMQSEQLPGPGEEPGASLKE
ncbi:sterigmatocystin 8-O-methyltransferase precursor [Purpureocillium lavendulum]|uniref:Sterigmatocystin 8-O-methyltransferase n=1 Tax=Purpureocillium lavendulum TaxID=1247861 RepID=A0AB34FL81_9HYPO|nr:sterigmatocystin 8-O-methyltransferase precursor [Purpureocillium lavendulum]